MKTPINGHSPGNGFSGSADRMPPYNPEIERLLLGSIILDATILDDVTEIVRTEDFFRDIHQQVYRVVHAMHGRGELVDSATVDDELQRLGIFGVTESMEFLRDCVGSVAHAANGPHYAGIVREKARVRAVIAAFTESLQEAYRGDVSSLELIANAETRLFTIGQSRQVNQTVWLATALDEAMDRIQARREGKVYGVATGFTDLNVSLGGGLPGGSLCILAARPSMGKTAFALDVCAHTAFESDMTALIFSLEMNRGELCERLISGRASVNSHFLKEPQYLVGEAEEKVMRVSGEIHSKPLLINDRPSTTVAMIASEARRQKSVNNIGLVVIDYVQLIEADPSTRKGANRQEHVSQISRSLKILAKQLDVPILLLSQLNRQAEARTDHRPLMSDLRESGSLEQDADIVLLLHRPEYYDANESPGVAEVIVAKNRNGPTGTVKLCFRRQFARFENLSATSEPDYGGEF